VGALIYIRALYAFECMSALIYLALHTLKANESPRGVYIEETLHTLKCMSALTHIALHAWGLLYI